MITFQYMEMGMVHSETWWLIDKVESYPLVYYCGYASNWHFDGAMVLSREKSLPNHVYDKISDSFSKAVGLDFSKFCDSDTTHCSN